MRLLDRYGFSSLTRRIVVLNLAGLVALLFGILYLNQFRAGLIDARVQSLLIQGEIIAGAVAASATADTNQVWVDPDKLMNISPGEMTRSRGENLESLEFPINPERVAPVLRRLVSPTRTRARIYDSDGQLLLDSQSLYSRGDILRFDLPSPQLEGEKRLLDRTVETVKNWLFRQDLPTYEELVGGRGYPEVVRALQGSPATEARVNKRGEMVVSVAVPIQRFRAIAGVLLLSTQGGDIDNIVTAERIGIFRVFLVAALVMVVLSVLLASTIAGPMRRLANAAERVRQRVDRRADLPDFSDRTDEIGHLSAAFRDMTDALYSRLEAIERFAADVAHELKNPLTSLRSAVETLPLAKNDHSRARLLEVIQHDVRRLDRLISDISDASRLDAELQRNDREIVDPAQVLEAVVEIQNEVRRDGDVVIRLEVPRDRKARDRLLVSGHDSRLGQVITNLIDNARSFSPPRGEVRVSCRRVKNEIEIVVEDDGPGIRPDALERIFERFYTDRPEQGFGQNSGLGLSISKQIVEAHGGRLWAENRVHPAEHDEFDDPLRLGARFILRLPAASK
ncbi:sensor histidine kinase [Terrihabitans rhizophilus]|uniref:histidine kinase n=1 Tax=Terrihabitans rhizophilus TaxID=3092662 RepID=A0ABU4RPD0_9HYPH|nr:sensor histidine kinase [Terrihabitans sp. PJ23]MDX6804601.1 sensor histidine kinase [Terrihabitans sp. PJ23]